MPPARPAAERFAEKINKRGLWSLFKNAPGQCWIWTAGTNRKGYGVIGINGRSTLAHRFSYELHVGPIPDGLELDHRCRVRPCSNPDHRPTGGRGCRQCARDRSNAAQAAKPKTPRQLKSHCTNGHEFNAENTGHTGTRRYCRQCSRDNSRAHMARKRAEAAQTPPTTYTQAA
ncbi:HNH endonuclease signature motif containing protein [Streptomyces coelicoflavus]